MRSPLRMRWRGAFIGIAIVCMGCVVACSACSQGPSRATCATGHGPASLACARCPAFSVMGASGCTCNEGTTAWLGACVAPGLAQRACGSGERLVLGVCTARSCPAGAVYDDGAEGCVSRGAVQPGDNPVKLEPDETVVCPSGSELRVTRGRGRCHPSTSCARGLVQAEPRGNHDAHDAGLGREERDAEADAPPCEPAMSCPAGSLADARAPHACSVFLTSRGFVDPARWLRLTAGEDGGPGSRWVCEPLDFLGERGLDARGVTRHVTLQWDIPGNDVSQASLTVRAVDDWGATQRLERQLESYADAFRSLGGSSTTTQAAVDVVCRVPFGPRPARVREDSGFGVPDAK